MNTQGIDPLRETAPPNRLLAWIKEPNRTHHLWLGKPCVLAAWLGLVLAVLSPPHGFGLPLCWFKSTTGLPCPGCGLTRSLACGIRGLFVESWHYHPLGLVILGLFVFTAIQSLFPRTTRQRLEIFMQSNPALFKTLYLFFASVFVGFGTARALFHEGLLCLHTYFH